MSSVSTTALVWWCAILVGLAHGSAAETAREGDTESAEAVSFLLPGDVYPEHYDLTLAYDIDPEHDFPFFGLADIKVVVNQSTDTITLHAKGFTVVEDQVQVVSGAGGLAVARVWRDAGRDFLSVRLGAPLAAASRVTLRLPVRGHVRADLDGVYVSSYRDPHTQRDEYLVASQLEAIAARKAFPCFDEPRYKASFSLTLAHRRHHAALSNMPLRTTLTHNPMEEVWPWDTMNEQFKSSASEWVWSVFEKSPRMSSYLVALVVGRLARNDGAASGERPGEGPGAAPGERPGEGPGAAPGERPGEGPGAAPGERPAAGPGADGSAPAVTRPTFTTWARPAAIQQTEYASEIGPKVLAYFEEFFNISYPLPKMDQVALPEFAAGAMENWGLVTYRETALLVARDGAVSDRARVAEVVAHELAHQWFGNLVTMQWWSELWLNEGFATYMSTYGVSAVEPTWRVREQDAADNVRAVWRLDALRSSHPVAVAVADPRRIAEIFDDISYRKGAALVRMMMTLLGEKVFRAGLHNYLLKHSYGNANQESLWEELTRARDAERGDSGSEPGSEVGSEPGSEAESEVDSAQPELRAVMHSWSSQAGYPLVTATRDYRDGTLNLTQRRYLSGGGGARRDGCQSDGSGSEQASCHDDEDEEDATWWVPLGLLVEPKAGAGEDEEAAGNAQARWLAAGAGRAGSPQRARHAAACHQWLLLNAHLVGPYRVNYDGRNWQLLARALAVGGAGRAAVPPASRAQLVADAMELAAGGRLPYAQALQITNYLSSETDYIPLAAGYEALGRLNNLLQRTAEYGAFGRWVRGLVAAPFERAGGLEPRRHADPMAEAAQVSAARWLCRVEGPECTARADALFAEWRARPAPDVQPPVSAALRGVVVCAGVRRGGAAAWRWALQRATLAERPHERAALRAALACTREPWLLAQYVEWCVTNSSAVRRADAARVFAAVASSPAGHYVARDFLYARTRDLTNAMKGRSLGLAVRSIVTGFIEQRELDEFLRWREQHKELLEDAKMTIDQAVETAANNIEWTLKYKKSFIDEIRALTTNTE